MPITAPASVGHQLPPACDAQRSSHVGDGRIDADDEIELRNDGGRIGEVANLTSEAENRLLRRALIRLGFRMAYLQADKANAADRPEWLQVRQVAQ